MSTGGALPWSARVNGGTCKAGPWCDRPGYQGRDGSAGTEGYCDAHAQQVRRGKPLAPIEGAIEALLYRTVPQPDLREGACVGEDAESFANPRSRAQAVKRAGVCATCPVLWECRDWALATLETEGRNDGDPWPVSGIIQGGMWFKAAGGGHKRPPVDLVAIIEGEEVELAAQ